MTVLSDAIDALSPTHYWKCDETSGTTLNDTGGGTTQNLSLIGTFTLGAAGPGGDNALDLDGSSGYAQKVVAPSALGTSNTGTVVWFQKFDTFTGGGNWALTLSPGAFNASLWGWAGKRASNGCGLHGGLDAAGANIFRRDVDSPSVSTGVWYMFGWTHSGSTHQIWQDNGLVNQPADVTDNISGTASASSWINNVAASDRITIGAAVRLAGNIYHDGGIAHVAYWDGTALTEGQLQGIFNASAGQVETRRARRISYLY